MRPLPVIAAARGRWVLPMADASAARLLETLLLGDRAEVETQNLAWFKKGSGTVAGTARRVLGTTVPDPFLNHAKIITLGIMG